MLRLFTCLKPPTLFSPLRLLFCTNNNNNSTRLQRYAAIKSKNTLLKSLKKQSKQLQKSQSNPISLQTDLIKCQGCSAHLQSQRLDKYGYIDREALLNNLTHNRQMVEKQFERTDDTIRLVREVEQEMGVAILPKGDGKLENLENLEVLMRLEEKIEESNRDRQVLVDERWKRKELLCRRCFYLKHHNRLPDQLNHPQFILDQTDQQQLLDRIFLKKGLTFYLYLVDIFDVLGTLTQPVLKRLFQSRMQFTILLTKYDMITKKYFNYIEMKPVVKMQIRQTLEKLKEAGEVDRDYRLEDYLQEMYFVSTNSNVGVTKLKKKILELECKVQMLGYPNTGKTTLLNQLTRLRKPTSTVPGTSLSFEIGRVGKVRVFDCPGFYNRRSLVNLITTPNDRSLLTWKQPHFSPGLLTNSIIFYGGMLQAQGIRIILFSNTSARSISPTSSTKWLLQNYSQFWKGLPQLPSLNIQRHELFLTFKNGIAPDIEISGYGFIGLRLCRTHRKVPELVTKKVVLYLPEVVEWRLRRRSLVLGDEVHNRAGIRRGYRLQRGTRV